MKKERIALFAAVAWAAVATYNCGTHRESAEFNRKRVTSKDGELIHARAELERCTDSQRRH